MYSVTVLLNNIFVKLRGKSQPQIWTENPACAQRPPHNKAVNNTELFNISIVCYLNFTVCKHLSTIHLKNVVSDA